MKESEVFSRAYPIVGISVYSGGVIVVHRKSLLQGKQEAYAGRKGRAIVKFTPKSMARMVATVNASPVTFKSMITLTYPYVYPKDGKIIKLDMNNFLTMMREHSYGNYLWFLEFQARGAPHFHILSEQKAISPRMRIRAAETWVGRMHRSSWFTDACVEQSVKRDVCFWEYTSKVLSKAYWFALRQETWEYLREPEGAQKYATKYACKEYQKVPPTDFDGIGRFWGCSKRVSLGKGVLKPMSEERLRKYLTNTDHATAEWDVLPKFLFGVRQEALPGEKPI